MTVNELKPSLLALPDKERIQLADFLYDSVEDGHHYVSDDEVMRRIAEADADPSIMLTKEEFEAGLRDVLRR